MSKKKKSIETLLNESESRINDYKTKLESEQIRYNNLLDMKKRQDEAKKALESLNSDLSVYLESGEYTPVFNDKKK